MKFFLAALSFLLLYSHSKSQITFQKQFGGATCFVGNVLQTSDGGYVVSAVHGDSLLHLFIIKLDSTGDTLWTRSFISTQFQKSVIKQTYDNGYILAAPGINSSATAVCIFLIKNNSLGDTLWTRSLNRTTDLLFTDIIQTQDSGYMIIASTESTVSIGEDIVLIKTDSHANLLWTKSYGGPDRDFSSNILNTNDGGYLIVGNTMGFGASYVDPYLIKTDSNGNMLWSKVYTGTPRVVSAQQTSDGGFILGSLGNGIIYMKIDSLGALSWSKWYWGPNIPEVTSIQQTNDGGFIIGGGEMNVADPSDAFLFKVNSLGDSIWLKTFGSLSYEKATSISQTSDGGYIIAGNTDNILPDTSGVLIIKTDSFGSGFCYQSGIPLFLDTLAIQVVNPSTIVSTTTFTTENLSMVLRNITNETPLCLTSGFEPLSENIFGIAPNPTDDHFTISSSTNSIKEIQIYNLWGQVIYSSQLNPNSDSHTIKCDQYPKGIYFVNVSSDSGSTIKKLVIQ